MFTFLQSKNPSSKILNKRIPTLVGLFVLVSALVAGTLLIGKGGGVFAPRATPQTTPTKIELTNVTDRGFTVSFLTDESTVGFVKYGTEPDALKSQASDDRVQLEGKINPYQAHHITVSGLQPNTAYYYTLGTGSNADFYDNEKPFTVKTTARNGAPAAARTIYGSVSNQVGNPAEGAIVYITLKNAGKMSSLVKSSGSWAVPLSNARTLDGSSYAQVEDSDVLLVTVQGMSPSDVVSQETIVSEAQPVPTIALGAEGDSLASKNMTQNATTEKEQTELDPFSETGILEIATDDFIPATLSANKATPSASPSIMPPIGSPSAEVLAANKNTKEYSEQETETNTTTSTNNSATQSATTTTKGARSVLILDLEDPVPVIETSQPKIIGKAAPSAVVTIEVHSETAIYETVSADANGNFQLNIAELSKNLEPGEHTVTYSYTDPTTGLEVEKTVSFTVAATPQSAGTTTTTGSSTKTTSMSTATTGQSSAQSTSTTTGQTTQSTTSSTTKPFGSGNPFPPTAAPATSASATTSGRTAMPATDAAIPVSGSVGTTLALIMGGVFFITSGTWSFWISRQLNKENA